MLKLGDSLYFSGISRNHYQSTFWNDLRRECGTAGRSMIDLAAVITPLRFVSRSGQWELPWPQEVPNEFKMPTLDKNFKKSFAEVTNDRAREIAELIRKKDCKIAVMYSGGIDSTVIMSALIKNLSREELKNIVISANSWSMVENPTFWKKFIWNKFKILKSNANKYDDLVEQGYYPLAGESGDSIFGASKFLNLQQFYDYYVSKLSETSRRYLSSIKNKTTSADVHYSNYKDLIILSWNISKVPIDSIVSEETGEYWYNKFEKNIKTSSFPVVSLHDYYWWMMFNLKWINCRLRGAMIFNDRLHCKKLIENYLIEWYDSIDYQKWSMANNNNGEKIDLSNRSFKISAKRYIHELDKNDWYFYFKLKLFSNGAGLVFQQDVSKLNAEQYPHARFGLDNNYNLLKIEDPSVQDYIKHYMINFKETI